MKIKELFLVVGLGIVLGVGNIACTYENNDNPNEYPDQPEPKPDPEPEPKPDANPKYLAAAYGPNCYIVKPGETIDIPILKAYAIWVLYPELLGDTNLKGLAPEPVLIWQDDPELIVNFGLIQGTTAEESSIAVTVANKVGNAIIGIRIDGTIRWSWHIWVTKYDPSRELVVMGKVYPFDHNDDGETDYLFMDRNLGAVNTGTVIEATEADSLAACGLLYQWGRKDPFPGDHHFRHTNDTDYNYYDSKPIYDAQGVLLTEGSKASGTGIRSIYTDQDVSAPKLTQSITNPMHFLMSKGPGQDWIESEEPIKIKHCDTLWCGTRGKTPFDPCPAKWRVPANRNGLFPWNSLNNATTLYSHLGVFPYAGYRYRVGGGCLKNSGFQSCIWSGEPPNGTFAAYLDIYITPHNKLPSIKLAGSTRCDGKAIRCVKEY